MVLDTDDLTDSDGDDHDDAWLSIDEFRDVAVSLKMLQIALANVASDRSYWKTSILFAHSALQGACVSILTRTDGLGALREDCERAFKHKLYGETDAGRNLDDSSVEWPDEFVAELPELLKRLPDDLRLKLPGRRARSYPNNLEGDLRRLHEWRNRFTHFPPTTWYLEIAGLPRILRGAVEHTQKIVTSDSFKRWNHFRELALGSEFSAIQGHLEKLEVEYNPPQSP